MARLRITQQLVALSLAACSSGQTSGFGNAPLQVVTTDSKAMSVEVWSAPDPPTHGSSTFRLVVRDAVTGSPVTGLTLRVDPWMPAMGHGGSITPTITEEGGGAYLVQTVLFMPGEWQLRTSISGVMSDSVSPEFEVL